MREAKPLLVCLLVAVFTAGCGHLIYTSGPYQGKVIDAETKQPLVGAAVVAVWNWEGFGLGHPTEGFYDALEVLTDVNGEFTMPQKTFVPALSSGWIQDPRFSIYFPGYAEFPFGQTEPKGEALDTAFREHSTVELPRLKTIEERRRFATLPFHTFGVPESKMPNLLRLVNSERKALGLQPLGGWEGSK